MVSGACWLYVLLLFPLLAMLWVPTYAGPIPP